MNNSSEAQSKRRVGGGRFQPVAVTSRPPAEQPNPAVSAQEMEARQAKSPAVLHREAAATAESPQNPTSSPAKRARGHSVAAQVGTLNTAGHPNHVSVCTTSHIRGSPVLFHPPFRIHKWQHKGYFWAKRLTVVCWVMGGLKKKKKKQLRRLYLCLFRAKGTAAFASQLHLQLASQCTSSELIPSVCEACYLLCFSVSIGSKQLWGEMFLPILWDTNSPYPYSMLNSEIKPEE